MRPSISSVEFLRSEVGKQFARAFVGDLAGDLAAHPQPSDPSGPALEPEDQFDELVDDFMALVHPYQPVDDFRPHLVSVYRDRFIDLCPAEGPPRTEYYFAIFKILPFLALLTVNVWKLDTGRFAGYPRPRQRPLSLYHLQWAREAFGWWRANVERLPYYLDLKRPCRQSPGLDAMADALGDALIVKLPRRGKVEVEDGCPIC